MKRPFSHRVRHALAHAFGDCDRCGHSIMYHAAFVGCLKCGCGEYE